MAFKEYRNFYKKPKAHELDIERFAYDVFAYMLPICGFPEERIPITSREENIYNERDFVSNFGLSVLPLALYMRDDWKCSFEMKYEQNGLFHTSDIEFYLGSVLLNCAEIDEEDTLSKVQFSLALYSEFTLFCNYKGFDTYFRILPKLWSRLCKQFITESEDLLQTSEFSFTTHPDISESWITSFIRDSAVPYGSTTNVSYKFSLYAFECLPTNNNNTDVISKEGIASNLPDVLAQASKVSDINLEPSLIEDSKTGLCTWSGKGESLVASEQLQKKNGENSIVEANEHAKNANGLTFDLQQYLKRRKRNISPKLEIEDTFKEINLEKDDVSPENRDTKRRRKTSNEDILE